MSNGSGINIKSPKKSYAILGATGATGSHLLKCLSDREDVHLHLYARSATKLSTQNPELASNPSVTLHIGELSNTSLLAECLRKCSVIFSTVAVNVNAPGTNIAQRTAHSVASALQLLRDENRTKSNGYNGDWKCPLVIVLSAAPLNDRLSGDAPRLMKMMVNNALKYVYADLREAAKYYRAEYPWIPVVQAQPGALVDKESAKLPVAVTEDGPQHPMSYGDLARGMISIADDGSTWAGKDVGFKLDEEPGFDVGLLKNLFVYLVPGLVYTAFPWVYHATHRS